MRPHALLVMPIAIKILFMLTDITIDNLIAWLLQTIRLYIYLVAHTSIQLMNINEQIKICVEKII